MPAVSEQQRRAMHAAAEGRSTIGIPKEVGEKFVAHDSPQAAGIALITPDRRALFVRRAGADHRGEWCFPGGMIEEGETPEQAARRELYEETGILLGLDVILVADVDSEVAYRTFRARQPGEIEPELDGEHDAHAWASIDDPPQPLHPGVEAVLKALAMDGDIILALDKDSVRSRDRFGRMRVEVANISKAAINPYLGREIPGWEQLGLKPDRIYRLLRDPAELERAVESANDVPILLDHVPVSATTNDSHQPDLVVGSTSKTAAFSHPFLSNGLVIWAKSGIDAIESGEKKELSSSYSYRPDMTPGTFEGESYDGVMRDIEFNHVALVKDGRAGPDVVVGDSNEEIEMALKLTRTGFTVLGALAAAVPPLLAKDAAPVDLVSLVKDLTPKNLKDRKAQLKTDLTAALNGKLAKDASIEGVVKLIDAIEGGTVKDADPDMVTDPNGGVVLAPEEQALDQGPIEKVKAFLAGKLSPEDMAQVEAMCAATDEPPPFKGKPEVGKGPNGKTANDEDKDKDDEKVDKPAMDAAIAAAVKAEAERQAEIRKAERDVRPYIGELSVAFDSAEKVYRHALAALGVKDIDKVHVTALPTILNMQPKPGAKKAQQQLASDSAPNGKYAERFPGASNIAIG